MKILIAPDKFKDSLTAQQVCSAIREGILKNRPDASITVLPLADGGEGTSEILTYHARGRMQSLTVAGPLFEAVQASYGVSADGSTAFIEMAKASGLSLLSPENRNPLYTTTYGTGELIRDAIDNGVKKVILGIGGSATHDAGTGMAAALGYKFLDVSGSSLKPIGKNLNELHSIRRSLIPEQVRQTEFITLCDVDNPLYGPDGAAYVYAPQKGAPPEMLELLDNGLRNFEKVVRRELGIECNFPGAGAAGGLGAGTCVFLNSTLQKGIDHVASASNLEKNIEEASLIITGEGKLDRQSFQGKVISKVCGLAKEFQKPLWAVCGICALSAEEIQKAGIQKVISLTDQSVSMKEAIQNAYPLIAARFSSEYMYA